MYNRKSVVPRILPWGDASLNRVQGRLLAADHSFELAVPQIALQPGQEISGDSAAGCLLKDASVRHSVECSYYEYWDDVNSYSTRQVWLQKPLPIIAETLQVWSLMVNTLNTVSFTVSTLTTTGGASSSSDH